MVDSSIPLPPHSRVVRKSIARVLTVINQTQKENLRKFYKVRAAFSTNVIAARSAPKSNGWDLFYGSLV